MGDLVAEDVVERDAERLGLRDAPLIDAIGVRAGGNKDGKNAQKNDKKHSKKGKKDSKKTKQNDKKQAKKDKNNGKKDGQKGKQGDKKARKKAKKNGKKDGSTKEEHGKSPEDKPTIVLFRGIVIFGKWLLFATAVAVLVWIGLKVYTSTKADIRRRGMGDAAAEMDAEEIERGMPRGNEYAPLPAEFAPPAPPPPYQYQPVYQPQPPYQQQYHGPFAPQQQQQAYVMTYGPEVFPLPPIIPSAPPGVQRPASQQNFSSTSYAPQPYQQQAPVPSAPPSLQYSYSAPILRRGPQV